ncbi:hypothetical protein BDF22DRAFT_522239 [Syncephalis plumigaleata]|nr:hypothetical protein BDF22DRAFT_522239 [Syncephalis plumigaleata]
MFEDTSFQAYRSARIEARFSGSTEIYRQRDEQRAVARASGSNAHIAIPSLSGATLSSSGTAHSIGSYSGELTSLPSISSMIRAAMPIRAQSTMPSSKHANRVSTSCDFDMYDSDDLDEVMDKENVPPEDIPHLQGMHHNPELLATGLLTDEERDEHPTSDDSDELMTSEADLPDIVSSLESSTTMFSSSGYPSSMASFGYSESDCSTTQCFYLPELFDQEECTTGRLRDDMETEESAYRAKRRRVYEYPNPSGNTRMAVRRSARLNPARLARV